MRKGAYETDQGYQPEIAVVCYFAGYRHVDGGRGTVFCTSNVLGDSQSVFRRRRRKIKTYRQPEPGALHRDLPRGTRRENREAGRRLLQLLRPSLGDPRFEGHLAAAVGRGPRFSQVQERIWCPRRVVEWPETLDARLD